MTDRLTYAKLADAVYGGTHENSIPTDQGWEQINLNWNNVDLNGDGQITDDDKKLYETNWGNGFAAAAYKNGSSIVHFNPSANKLKGFVLRVFR